MAAQYDLEMIAGADGIARNLVHEAIEQALVIAITGQLKAGMATPLTLDIVGLRSDIDTKVQRLADDMEISVTHPITGQSIQPTIIQVKPA